ncbi:unnamed protein product, partial [marine sediment metagenome]
MLKNKKKAKTKGKKKTYSRLEKIQLHINKYLGMNVPETLPPLSDEEYLILQSKIIALKNVKIGSTNEGLQMSSNLFQTPILLSDTSYPQVPQGMPVGLPPAISQGYQVIGGEIVPQPLPSRIDAIGSQTELRQIEGPVEQQHTTRAVAANFGTHQGAGSTRGHQHPTYDDTNPENKPTHKFLKPTYIGPHIIKTASQIDEYNTKKRQELNLEHAEAIVDAMSR